MKRMFTFMLIATLFFTLAIPCSNEAWADQAESGSYGDYEYEIRDGRLILTRYTGSEEEVIIPSEMNGHEVKELSGTFGGLGNVEKTKGVKKVVIPETVDTIGDSTFLHCTYLTEVVIPEGVTKLGFWTFYGCTSLASIVLPDSLTDMGDMAFNNCNSLREVVIPKNIERFDVSSFWSCANLEKIKVADGNPVYDSRDNCNAVIETDTNTLLCGGGESTIPEDVVKIGFGAFYGRSCLKQIAIGKGIQNISEDAFHYCDNLEKIVVDSENTTYDSRNDCNAIIETKKNVLIAGTSATQIPNNVVEIGDSAFSGRTSLSSLTLPESVVKIRMSAFEGCTGLESVKLPEGLESIEIRAFCDCTSLKEIVLPSTVTTLGARQFSGCKNLETVELPDGILIIDEAVFESCHSLKNITIPHSVQEIGESAFSGCSSLTGIEIPNSVTSIGAEAFMGCNTLKSIELPEHVTAIQTWTFEGCYSLASIRIPASVTTISDDAFENSNESMVIKGVKGSVAESFASEHGYQFEAYTDTTSHTHTGGTATCTSKAKCSICGERYGKVNSSVHSGKKVVKNKKAATYAAKGYTGDTYCADCGKKISSGKSIAKLTVAKVTLSSVKSSKAKTLTVKWKKNAKATGYELQYSTSSKFTKSTTKTSAVKSAKTVSKTLKSLKAGKKYYVRIRAYKTEKKTNYYSAWSSVKNDKIKK